VTVADLRSPFDAHSRHVTCRVGGRIVGYVRVIFVDGDPARSQYVALGGHVVPPWLWDAGFVEGGAGAIHPDFQRAGLYGPLMRHMLRVAVQSGHRYVLGACPDELLTMYRRIGFETLEERIVTPKPGWSFRSHLLYADAARSLGDAGLAVAA
jgi:GNAT superfamily N-acetyltransferase